VIHHVHQDQFRERFGPVLAFVGRKAEGAMSRVVYRRAAFVAVSASTRTDVIERLRIERPIVIAPNGGFERPGDDVAPEREPGRIVCVSRLVPYKQVGLLIEAVSCLARNGRDVRLEIVGDGPERSALEAASLRLGVGDRVHFSGHLSDRDRDTAIARAQIHVIPSAREGWGLTVMEAARLGVPSVGFRVRGVSDSIVDGVTGWLADKADGADGLADAIGRGLDVCADDSLRTRVESSARSWAASFTWRRTVERLSAAAHIASRSTSERACAPVVIAAPRVPDGWMKTGDEAVECAHGVSVLSWDSCPDETSRRAESVGGTWRLASKEEMHIGPKCDRCGETASRHDA